MPNRTETVQPFRTDDGNHELLRDFARRMVPKIAPGFNPPTDFAKISFEDVPYEWEEWHYREGDDASGFNIVYRGEYEPRAGGRAVDKVTLETYGLPDGFTFQMECTRSWYDPRFLQLDVSAPDEAAVNAIADAFKDEFTGEVKLTALEIQRELTSLIITVKVKQWESAELKARDLLKQLPDEPQVLFALGVARAAQDDLDEGEKYLRMAVERDPAHHDALYNLGNILLKRGQPEDAVALYRQSLAAQPENHPVFYQLGQALEAAGQPEEALAAYRDAVRTSPNPDGEWSYRGMDFTQQARDAITRLEEG